MLNSIRSWRMRHQHDCPAVDAKVKEDTVFITPGVDFKGSFHTPLCRSGCEKKRVLVMGELKIWRKPWGWLGYGNGFGAPECQRKGMLEMFHISIFTFASAC